MKPNADEDIDIRSIEEFKENIHPCCVIKIKRNFGNYYHYLLVTCVHDKFCDIIHYTSPPGFLNFFRLLLTGYSGVQILKQRLVYEEFGKNVEMRKVLNFATDKISIEARSDYPQTQYEIKECVSRAESRVEEKRYLAGSNNCEHFVNWVLSGKSCSSQISTSQSSRCKADVIDSSLNGCKGKVETLTEFAIMHSKEQISAKIKKSSHKTKSRNAESAMQNPPKIVEDKIAESTIDIVYKQAGSKNPEIAMDTVSKNVKSSFAETKMEKELALENASADTVNNTTKVRKGSSKGDLNITQSSQNQNVTETVANDEVDSSIETFVSENYPSDRLVQHFVRKEFENLSKRISDFSRDENMSEADVERNVTRERMSSILSIPGGICGVVIGQALIPIPFVGSVVGAAVGGMTSRIVGGVIGGTVYDMLHWKK